MPRCSLCQGHAGHVGCQRSRAPPSLRLLMSSVTGSFKVLDPGSLAAGAGLVVAPAAAAVALDKNPSNM